MNYSIPDIPVLATQINDTDLFEKADGPASGQSQRISGAVIRISLNAPLAVAGSPEGAITANPGTPYLNLTDESFWVKKTGTGNTGWIELIAGA